MKLERNKSFERSRPPKSIEALRAAPEEKQPLQIDLQHVVESIFAVFPDFDKSKVLDNSLGYVLPGLVNMDFFRSTVLKEVNEVEEKNLPLNTWKDHLYKLNRLAFLKLWDHQFTKRKWNKRWYKKYIDTMMNFRGPDDEYDFDFINRAFIFIILFPEEKQRILSHIQPIRTRQQSRNQLFIASDYDDIRLLAKLRLMGLNNSLTDSLVKANWSDWNESLERHFRFLENDKGDSYTRNYEAHVIFALAIGMHILAAEKAVINDQGMPEIIPNKKGLPKRSELPDRSLT